MIKERIKKTVAMLALLSTMSEAILVNASTVYAAETETLQEASELNNDYFSAERIGSANRGYHIISNGSVAVCIDLEKDGAEPSVRYAKEEIGHDIYADLDSVFIGLTEELSRGTDSFTANSIAQLCVWEKLTGVSYRDLVEFYYRSDGIDIYNDYLSHDNQGYEVSYTLYIPDNDKYQRLLSANVTPKDGSETEPEPEPDPEPEPEPDPEPEPCVHGYYGYEYVERVKATDSVWGEIDKVCVKCKEVLGTEKIHPYSEYQVVDENGVTQTVYGWFDDDYAKEVWKITNEYRQTNGLNALAYNNQLQDASDLRALESSVYFSHTRPNGIKWNSIDPKWKYGGENIALGHTTPEVVMTAWKNSSGHNRNLLYGKEAGQQKYKGLSVGCFHRYFFLDSYVNPYKPYERISWVQNFTFYEYE